MDKYNSEGYPDPTAYEALTAVAKSEAPKKTYRPLVYLAHFRRNTERNIERARGYCRFAVSRGASRLRPSPLPAVMDDDDREQRELGMFFALVLLGNAMSYGFSANLPRVFPRDR
jgi:hypothetical protein